MPTREEILTFVRAFLDQQVHNPADVWVALYLLLLEYIHGVPRITDSNLLKQGIWRQRAFQIEEALARALLVEPAELSSRVNVLMRQLYSPGTQSMNPVGIAFAAAIVHLIQKFATGNYRWQMEAKIGRDVFLQLQSFRRDAVDIVAFRESEPFAVISSKWGIRHDRIRDVHEEADTYKREVPALRFYVVTNEFNTARLEKVLTYPTINGVFHVRRALVLQVYGEMPRGLGNLKDLTDLFGLFPAF